MIAKETRPLRGRSLFNTRFAVAVLATTALGGTLAYADEVTFFLPGNLLLSRSVYDSPANIITPGVTQLPPGCTPGNCVTATADGTYPTVFNNAIVDASFGVTAPILIDEMLTIPSGDVVQTIQVPNSSERGVKTNTDQMVTSFSSKSEIGLNLSLDRNSVSFMGYLSPINAIDVSNSNTPDVVDPTNPVPSTDFRVVASVDQLGQFHFTKTNAYSGNNGRAAVLNNANGANVYYTTGNAGNGSNPQPNGVIVGAGAQIVTPSHLALSQQVDPGQPTPVGSFSVTELGDKADKVGKDTNFRGLTVFNNVIYVTKGSGSNGVNTVYFIDTSGSANGKPAACPTGSGVPSPSATLPTTPIAFNAANLQTQGVTPYNICVLNGFSTSLAKATTPAPMFPFGVFFANARTLYVTDEGNGDTTFSGSSFTKAAAQTTAGLQKWVLNTTTNTWSLAYTLQAGLNLGVPYTVKNYPTGINAATNLPWAPATDGLRNLTGRVNRDGTVSIWAITSTVSGGGDQGADPNRLVTITDKVAATTLPANETFSTVRTAKSGEVLRGISFTPGTGLNPGQEISSLLCDFGFCKN
ncbi:hypothetical protein [Bradyrhizobium sp.]|jgi:hypothetical protein|uniref:hypothetical protein n=1 Tax=Bradyrhizobium sp. TaxID=376 RepID=UPI003BAF11EA